MKTSANLIPLPGDAAGDFSCWSGCRWAWEVIKLSSSRGWRRGDEKENPGRSIVVARRNFILARKGCWAGLSGESFTQVGAVRRRTKVCDIYTSVFFDVV